MFSAGYSLRSGFPHSDISGSKLHCQLPRAFRRLVRPSSPVIAKASTTCTYSLDPITLSSLARPPATGNSFGAPPSPGGSMQSQPYRQPPILRAIGNTTFFHFVKEHRPRKGSGLQGTRPCRPDISRAAAGLVEDDGIEPTTPCLQSRCSPS